MAVTGGAGGRRIVAQNLFWNAMTGAHGSSANHVHRSGAVSGIEGSRYWCTVSIVPACVVNPLYMAVTGWSPLLREDGTTTLN